MNILRIICEEFNHFFTSWNREDGLGGYQCLQFPMNNSAGREMNELIGVHMLLLWNHDLFWGSNYNELKVEHYISCIKSPDMPTSLDISHSILGESHCFSSPQLLNSVQPLYLFFLKSGIISFLVASLFPPQFIFSWQNCVYFFLFDLIQMDKMSGFSCCSHLNSV